MAESRSSIGAGVLALALALSMLAAAPAAATDAFVSGVVLHLDGGDRANELVVRESGFGFVVDDQATGVRAGTGCSATTPTEALCTAFVREIRVDAGAGDDLVGLWGVDIPITADGGPGSDLVEGGRARDTLAGGDGDDTLGGRLNGDRLLGGAGDDTLAGSRGRDTLDGDGGDDILNSGASVGDVLLGDAGRDLLRAGHGGAFLAGGGGADLLIGRGNGDTLDPGRGADAIVGADPREDVVDCRRGDEARAEGGGTVPGCDRLPGSETVPEAWPPASGATAARLPGGNPGVRIRPVLRGDAARFTIWVEDNKVRHIALCVWTFNQAETRLKRFTKWRVQTKDPKSYQDDRFPKKSYFGIGYKGPCE